MIQERRFASILLYFICLIPNYVWSQNPASPPRDSTQSLPERSFDIFWQTFEDHYAFFKLRKIDWKTTYQTYRPRVNSTTSEDELFAILSEMVKPFEDDHINIIIPDKKEFTSEKPSSFLKEFPDEKAQESFWNMANHTLIQKGFKKMESKGPEFRGEKLFYFTDNGTYGYIKMGRCFVSLETEDDPKKEADLAGNILDSILGRFHHLKGVMIDVRDNIGGNDEFAYAVAGRFTSKKRLGHLKQSRKGGYEDFGDLERWYIKPLGENFLKPVSLLTNDQTASAGDVFALIMKALPKTRLIGENSQGIYSDMYEFELPNKWLISLSNQRYYSPNMVCYEGTGTPVDVVIKNTKQDIIQMSDPVVSGAIISLKKRTK